MNLEYKIARKPRRRTLSIVISHDNRIVIQANESLAARKIAEFVESKRAWICRTFKINDAYRNSYIAKQFINGEKFLYLGEEVSLHIEKGKNKQTSLNQGAVFIRLPDFVKKPRDYIKAKLVQWYKYRAYAILMERVGLYRRILDVEAKKIKIRTLKRTWANCSHLGVLTFSWRLIMAPLQIIDYVVVHELAHRIHHNHSKRFWRKVEKTIPEYKACKKWLKDNEGKLRW